MAEDIELHYFNTKAKDSEIEEYVEVNLEEEKDEKYLLPKKVNEFDFFTQHDVKESQKSTKKKKEKQKPVPSKLMDIINTELALVESPIVENAIEMIDRKKLNNSYLVKNSGIMDVFHQRKQHWRWDIKRGWGEAQSEVSPIFPRVLKNAVKSSSLIPVQYEEALMFDDIVSKSEDEKPLKSKFLTIELRNLKFTYHHNFSLEMLLSNKLVEVFELYKNVTRELTNISRNIKINRDTKDNLKRELLKLSPKKEDLRTDQTIRKYTGQMINLKDKYMEKFKEEKELLNKLISLWSDIENVREKSNVQRTPNSLGVMIITMDEETYKTMWLDTFNTEYSDLLDRKEYEFITEYSTYKKQKYDQKIEGKLSNLSKPKLHIDEENLKEQAERLTNALVSQNKIQLKLEYDEQILSLVNTAAKGYFYFKVFVDDIFVCESERVSCVKSYNIDLTESLSIQILPNNVSLAIVLYESSEEVSIFNIVVEDVKKNIDCADFVNTDFSYNKFVEPNTKFVGSGFHIKDIAAANNVRLKSSNVFKGVLNTTCKIDLKVGWNEKFNQNSTDQQMKSYFKIERKLSRYLHRLDKPSADDLKELIENIYDTDISKDQDMMNSINNLSKYSVVNRNVDFLKNNYVDLVRFKLLHLRNKGELQEEGSMQIPLYASQISTEQLNCLQKRKDREFHIDNFQSEKFAEMNTIEIQRHIGSKYLATLNKNMLKNLNENLLKKTYKDVVCDFEDLSIRSLLSKQTNLANLANISNGSRRHYFTEMITKEQEIFITVLRAFNLPDRAPPMISEENSEDFVESIAGYKLTSLRPFVEVSYLNSSSQTATGIGRHPTWNQTLKIKTKPGSWSSIQINLYDEQRVSFADAEDDNTQSRNLHYRCYNQWLGTLSIPLFNVLGMGKIRGTFKLNTPLVLLGYETNIGTKEANVSVLPEVAQLMRKETSYICLQITTKLSHLGALQTYELPIPSNSEDDYVIRHLNVFVDEYLNDFPSRSISLTFINSMGQHKSVTQFLQPLPLPDFESFPKNPRSESAVSKSTTLSSSSKSDRTRDVEKGLSDERDSIYSSYEAKSWKKLDANLDKLIDSCVRYVSLIPTYEVADSYVVSLMGVELLKILQGTPLDHTLLLASYFLYLGIKTWVVIGTGLPRGKSSYVLTKYDLRSRRMALQNEQLYVRSSFLSRSDSFVWYLYDATSGDKFDLRDVSCPLKTAHYVFDCENIWVNVQTSQDCESVSFDFMKSSDWKPVFDNSIFVMKQPIIADPDLYSRPSEVEQLREALENKLKSKIQKWRPRMKTIWNRYCSSLLKETLAQYEFWACYPSQPKPAPGHRFKQLMMTYKVYGFPLNMPFSNTKSVVSRIKSTNVHANDDPNIEFGLSVEVYGYPNDVLSVWVYLASILKI